MSKVIQAGTESVEVKQPDVSAIKSVPQPVEDGQIVLLTTRTTNQGAPPRGAGPLFSASWRGAGPGFEIAVQRLQDVSFDVVVKVDWAIIDR